MNHNLILDIIFKNNGVIVGGYAREWVLKGKPSDDGWSDIDIICEQENEDIIEMGIKKYDPDISVDFRVNTRNKSKHLAQAGQKANYSVNVFCWKNKDKCEIRDDPEFETSLRSMYGNFFDKIFEKAKSRTCIFVGKDTMSRDIPLESHIRNRNWDIIYPLYPQNGPIKTLRIE